MSLSKNHKLILTSLIAIVMVGSIFTFGVITPSGLNGYHTDYTDEQGVRHIEVGDPTQDNIPYHGVVTYTAQHPDGTVFLVAKSHNTRTVQGLNCLDQIMFVGLSPGKIDTNGTNVCTVGHLSGRTGAQAWNGFRVIGLINGTTSTHATLNGSDTYTLSVHGGTRACGAKCGLIPVGLTNQGSPANGTVASVDATNANFNKITITSPAFAFSGDAAGGTTINGAFLLNNTASTPATFAENSFTGVTLANTDTLTITWTITVS